MRLSCIVTGSRCVQIETTPLHTYVLCTFRADIVGVVWQSSSVCCPIVLFATVRWRRALFVMAPYPIEWECVCTMLPVFR